jgi:NAD(P)-dependent dehydrogenase (short-subunit alcohol dehydrogenase family)
VNLPGKVALITGGKRIGLVVAEQLAQRGADVALSYARSRPEAETAAERVRAAGRRAAILQADVSKPEACDALVQAAVAELGRLDILINMASVYARKPFDDLRADDWNATVNVDLRAAFLCAHAAAPHMRRQGGGRIINFSDWIARSGRPRYKGFVPYYVAKGGVIALTEALAMELAEDNILVNAIAPGPILAPIHETDSQGRRCATREEEDGAPALHAHLETRRAHPEKGQHRSAAQVRALGAGYNPVLHPSASQA